MAKDYRTNLEKEQDEKSELFWRFCNIILMFNGDSWCATTGRGIDGVQCYIISSPTTTVIKRENRRIPIDKIEDKLFRPLARLFVQKELHTFEKDSNIRRNLTRQLQTNLTK